MDEDFREIPGLGDFNLNLNNLVLGLAHRFLFGEQQDDRPVQSSPDEVPEVGSLAPVIKMKYKSGAVTMIIGRRESGKTVLAYRLAEIFGKPTFAISKEAPVPSWSQKITMADIADDMPPRKSTLFIDDLPLEMSSHNYHSTDVRTVEDLIPVCRHKRKLHLIFAAQVSAMVDKFTLDADIVFLKPPNMMFQDIERPAVARWYKQVLPIFDSMTEEEQKRHAVMLSQSYRGLVRIDMPTMGMS